jgi:predicted RNA-binding Zn-ribbon protein involved in translation (DUF1610 family)
MEFDPSAEAISCPYCGHSNPISKSEEDIRELDFHAFLAGAAEQEETEEVTTVQCSSCGARSTLDPNIASDACPFCGTPIVAQTQSQTRIKPRSLLPFKVTRQKAMAAFREWIQGLWFAPNKVKKYARTDASSLNGMYVPYWTYDARCVTWYTGQRGDDYYTTETYTTTENGKTVTKTRRVRRTRWTPVSGVVYDNFDDVLVLGSTSLPRKYADRLEPWDLENLTPYDESYLAGYRTETYQVDLEQGFEQAKDIMDDSIRRTIKRDIGGDHQRIHSVRTQHNNVTFKHLLLPVWISAYRFRDEVYRFLVNARTGEVQGERPWSWVKIALALLAAVAVIALVWYFLNAQ